MSDDLIFFDVLPVGLVKGKRLIHFLMDIFIIISAANSQNIIAHSQKICKQPEYCTRQKITIASSARDDKNAWWRACVPKKKRLNDVRHKE